VTAALKAIHLEDPIAPHLRAVLEALGEDPAREGLAHAANTPRRLRPRKARARWSP
jgi:GTP cyclohydrolase I